MKRPPDILRKSHAHTERKQRAEGKVALKRAVETELEAPDEARAVLIDLDGVVYDGDREISGARAAIAALEARGVARLFVTNTTSQPRSAIVAKLGALDIHVRPDEILTPPVVAVAWLKEHLTGAAALFVPRATHEDFAGCKIASPAEPAAAVVVGDYGDLWTAAELNRAFRLLMGKPTPRFVALGMTRYWRAPDGLRLDTGTFATALAHATGIEPVVLGKPARAFFVAALERLGVEARRAWMVGDDIKADIEGAQAAGLKAALVRTGKFREADRKLGIAPDAELASIGELPTWWMTNTGA